MERKRGRFGLLVAQSAVCAIIVAVVLLLRVVGGDLFTRLQEMFNAAVQEDVIGAVLPEHWQESVMI